MLCAVAIVPGAAVVGAGIGVDVEGVPILLFRFGDVLVAVSYTHLRAHETRSNLVCRLLLEKKKAS